MKLILIPLALALPLLGETVTLAWDANPELVDRYELYRLGPLTLIGSTGGTQVDISVSETQTVAVLAVAPNGNKSELSSPLVVSPWDTQDIPKLHPDGMEVITSTDGTVGPQGPRNDYHGALAIDESQQTFWHSEWGFPEDELPPHYIQIKLERNALVSSMRYLPRQDDHANGNVTAYEIQSSLDGITWEPWAAGTWSSDRTPKFADLPLRSVRYLKIWSFDRYAAAADIVVAGVYEPAIANVSLQIQSSQDLKSWADVAHTAISVPFVTKDFFRLKITTPAP